MKYYRFINWFLTILIFLLIINLVRSYIYLSKRGGIISEYETDLDKEKAKQEELKRRLAQVESPDFIEKEARNKLNLGKDGEMVLFMPSISPYESPTPTPLDTSANWQKWVKLFR